MQLNAPSPAYRAVAVTILFWVAAAGIRVGAMLAFWPGLSTDPDAYVTLAESWRQSGTYGLIDPEGNARPTAFRPPAYPALLAGTTLDGQIDPRQIAVLHLLLGLGTVLGTFVWGRVAHAARAGRLAAIGVAVDPILLNQAAQPMTETLATFLAVWAIAGLAWAAKRDRLLPFALCGFVLGLACLTRPTFLPVVVLWAACLGALSVAKGRRSDEPLPTHAARRMRFALLYSMLPVLALVGGWTLRNQIVLGAPVVATTHGGYTLLLGNNDDFYRWLKDPERTSIWTAERLQADLEQARLAIGEETEVEEDRRLQRMAREWIAAHPVAFAECSLYRLGRFWAPTPASVGEGRGVRTTVLRFVIGSWYVAAYLLAAAGLFAMRKRLASADFAPALLMTLAFVAVHAVYWTDVRMRAPILPIVYLFASLGVGSLADWLRKSR